MTESKDCATFVVMGASVSRRLRSNPSVRNLFLYMLQGDLAKKKIYPTLW